MTDFTPYSALAGGALIGLSAVMLMLINGRIAGISGIVGGVLTPHLAGQGWRLAFLAGLLLAPTTYALLGQDPPTITVHAPMVPLVLAAVLVGVGTQLGSGCTSGHGVCGLARLSPRSLAATLTFMGTAMVTVYIVRHLLNVGGAA